jgi:hypothetical protein
MSKSGRSAHNSDALTGAEKGQSEHTIMATVTQSHICGKRVPQADTKRAHRTSTRNLSTSMVAA